MNKFKKNIIKAYRYILSTQRWSLMYKNITDDNYIDIVQSQSLARADSFVIEKDEKVYIFFEEFIIEPNRKGYLSVGKLDTKTNKLINIQEVLEKEHHLSYPFIFKYKNEWYMIPETHSNKTIDLYKFISFPYKLEKVKTLISDIDAVDTTIIIQNGIVYLFTNVKKDEKIHNENLSIYYSNDLLSDDFTEHPKNPIQTDTKYARMAGSILEENNKLYRIAQDCSINYGSCIYKFEIEELSKTSYKERLVETIYPPKNCNASHTFSKSKNYEVIDVMKNENIFGMIKNFIKLLLIIPKKVLSK
jgi:hypothetical protein